MSGHKAPDMLMRILDVIVAVILIILALAVIRQ